MNPADATPARAFSIWNPGAGESCTKEQHDAYAVVGPDGKLYPTWHPPTGPGGCSFGHEHGRDPRGSDLYDDAGGMPFGVANEALAVSDPANPRDEDHVGHKVEWENDMDLQFSGRRVGRLHRQVRRADQAAPGHPLEGRVHQQPARAGLPHQMLGWHRDARDDADGDRHAGRVRPLVRPLGAHHRGHARRRPIRPTAAASAPSPTGPASSSSCWSRRASSPTSRRCTRPGRRRTASGGRTATRWRSSIPYFQVSLPSRYLRPGARADRRAGRSTCATR